VLVRSLLPHGGVPRRAVLFVDHDDDTRELFRRQVEGAFEALLAASAEEGLALLQSSEVSLVVCDYFLHGMSGLEFVRRIREHSPETIAILVSGYKEIEAVIEAVNSGLIFRFVLKPWRSEDLLLLLEQAFVRLEMSARGKERLTRLEALNRYLLNGEHLEPVAASARMLDVLAAVRRVADTNATVLLEGESGTGKELLARMIHRHSARSSGPLISVNCGALAEGLLESELFGHERGAFTGAERRHLGKFELADGGTLFLDEIGDISPRLQVMLLRVLQERAFERVGGSERITVDVRVIAATHHSLKQLVDTGSFRADLFYRLSVFPIHVPPLRERPEDIPVLARTFLARGHSAGKRFDDIDQEAMCLLCEYHWPGNARELQNVIERAAILSDGPVLDSRRVRTVLGQDLIRARTEPAAQPATSRRIVVPQGSAEPAWRQRVRVTRRSRFEHALVEAGGNLSRAARLLGLKRSTFLYQARKAGLI
jgi:DNA-binding NtrC family response regulator